MCIVESCVIKELGDLVSCGLIYVSLVIYHNIKRAGAGKSCRSAFSDVVFATYSKVCCRVIGESAQTHDVFRRFISNQNTIEGNYLEGI